MGTLLLIGLIYFILILLTALSFAKGNQVAGMCLVFIMVIGIFTLGYLWFTSPM